MTYDERRIELVRVRNELEREKRKFKNANLKEYLL